MKIAFVMALGLHVAAARRSFLASEGRPLAVVRDGKVVDLSPELEARGFATGTRRSHLLSLCPETLIVPFDEERSEEFRRDLLDLYAAHVPAVEPVSLAETFLDVGGLPTLPFPCLARQAQEKLGVALRFGLGPTKLVARAAGLERAGSPHADTLVVSDVSAFLSALPVTYLYPLPEEISSRLMRQGFSTIGQVRELPLAELARQFGWPMAHQVAEAAAGGRPDPVRALWPGPFHAFSRNFEGGLNDRAVLSAYLAETATRFAREMSGNGLACGELAVSFRWDDGTSREVSRRLTGPTRSRAAVLCVLERLAERLLTGTTAPPVGVGVRAGRLVSSPAPQLDFGFGLPAGAGGFGPPTRAKSDEIKSLARELAWRYTGRTVHGGVPEGRSGSGQAGSPYHARRESLLSFYDPLRAKAHVQAH